MPVEEYIRVAESNSRRHKALVAAFEKAKETGQQDEMVKANAALSNFEDDYRLRHLQEQFDSASEQESGSATRRCRRGNGAGCSSTDTRSERQQKTGSRRSKVSQPPRLETITQGKILKTRGPVVIDEYGLVRPVEGLKVSDTALDISFERLDAADSGYKVIGYADPDPASDGYIEPKKVKRFSTVESYRNYLVARGDILQEEANVLSRKQKLNELLSELEGRSEGSVGRFRSKIQVALAKQDKVLQRVTQKLDSLDSGMKANRRLVSVVPSVPFRAPPPPHSGMENVDGSVRSDPDMDNLDGAPRPRCRGSAIGCKLADSPLNKKKRTDKLEKTSESILVCKS